MGDKSESEEDVRKNKTKQNTTCSGKRPGDKQGGSGVPMNRLVQYCRRRLPFILFAEGRIEAKEQRR